MKKYEQARNRAVATEEGDEDDAVDLEYLYNNLIGPSSMQPDQFN